MKNCPANGQCMCMKKRYRRIKNRIQRLLTFGRIIMLQGYKNSDGSYAYSTQIGSSTFIHNRKLLRLGEQVFIGHYNFIDSSLQITIGDGCQITNFISILNHSSHLSIRLNALIREGHENARPEGFRTGKVEIGAFTFIGPHVVIMPDTKIGKGCLVKAYSYLQGEYPDFSILAGNPARILGSTLDLDKPYLDKKPGLRISYEERLTNNYSDKIKGSS